MNIFGDNRWLVFGLPGFVALFVAGFISDFPEVRDVQLPVVYIALTILSVVIPLLWLHVYGRFNGVSYSIETISTKPSAVFMTFVCAIILGFMFGLAHTTDYVSRTLRYMFGKDLVLVSNHSEPLSVLFRNVYKGELFADELDGQPHVDNRIQNFANRYVRITVSEKEVTRSYEGIVTSYFGRRERRQVYLSPACHVQGADVKLIRGPGLWLNLEKVENVEVIYESCSQCSAQVEIAAGKPLPVGCPFK